jgi:U3 small nucleolar RNA-associated protein 14
MVGRQAHGRAPDKKPRAKNNSKKRTLDAFAIASHQISDDVKIRKNRLGAQEGGNRPGKRRRDEDGNDEYDEEESNTKKQRNDPAKGRFDELEVDEGSDSEGNEWKMGEVDSDDDSDLDSDEAFGESDEERFEGFAFSGSTKKDKKKNLKPPKDVNLDEDEEDDSDSELEEGDLGEGAVDLADMLDASESEEEETRSKDTQDTDDSTESDEEDDGESDEDSSISSADDDDETSDPTRIAALQSLIASLPQADETVQAPAKQRTDGASEYAIPSDYGLTSKTKLTLEDLGLPGISDPNIKKSLKFIESDAKSGKKKGGPAKLEVPLARRQQDRLDRSSAYAQTKETLGRWTDTIKHNRRAEHLMFPLPDNDLAAAHSNKQLIPVTQAKPFNELEAAIQNILEESGLATVNGKDDEDQIREYEELETKNMSIEEVKTKRAQLRIARDLLFREEAKSKRIKKIKSKSYRKVHRKQREKENRQNQEALAEGGYVLSEDELEAQDRRRANERMSAKHRGSKWAKATKQTGRATWDEDARSGITEMARRDEELRKRVEGRVVRKEFDDDSDASSSNSDQGDSDDEETEESRIQRQLSKVTGSDLLEESAPGGKLANMKFMRRAEEARKKDNDAMVEDIRRELAGEGSEDEEVGDEPEGSNDEDDETELVVHGVDNSSKPTQSKQKSKGIGKAPNSNGSKVSESIASEGGAWSKVPLKKSVTINDAEAKRRRHRNNDAMEVEELDLAAAALVATQTKPKKARVQNTVTFERGADSEESSDENTVQLPFAIQDQDLIQRAFAGADVVGEFEAEKIRTVQDEDDKIIDNTLPGWGSWTGDGVSKREKARNKGKILTKIAGVKAKNRRDAKLDRVIINEKRVKKVFRLFICA